MKHEKAKCKDCGALVSANVARMKVHQTEKHENWDKETDKNISTEFESSLISNSNMQNSSLSLASSSSQNSNITHSTPANRNREQSTSKSNKPKQSTLTEMPAFIKTTKLQKMEFDAQCAKFIYGTNSAFSTVEHAEFVAYVSALRPGYLPPNRHQIAGQLLDAEYVKVMKNTETTLKNKIVCLSIDGWSNVSNDPVICACVTDPQTHKVFLVDTVDTSGHPHCTEYLAELTSKCIIKCKEQFSCKVGSVVTDNANNMKAMRAALGTSDKGEVRDVITYGCSAHVANLLCRDIRDESVIDKVKNVIKYFKLHHDPKAKYKQAGGKHLSLPIDVRWNSIRNCLNSFICNYVVLSSVASTYRRVFDEKIVDLILEGNLITSAQLLVEKYDQIGIALNKLQSDQCYLSDAFEVWTDLYDFFNKNSSDSISDVNVDFLNFMERHKLAVSTFHMLSNTFDPRFRGKRVNQSQRKDAMNFLQKENPEFISELIKFTAESDNYLPELFDEKALKNTNPFVWWKSFSVTNSLSQEFTSFILKLFSCVASSAGIERLFSSFGIVQSKLRNRLGIKKAAKLVTIFRNLNEPSKKKMENEKKPEAKRRKKNVEGLNETDEEDDVSFKESDGDYSSASNSDYEHDVITVYES